MTFGTYRASPCVPSIAPDKTQEDPLTPTTTLRGLAALLSLGAAFSAQAANRQYPGPAAPCNTTLQACIDGADSGDTIILVTDSHIAEDVTIRKNLTLTPGQAPARQHNQRDDVGEPGLDARQRQRNRRLGDREHDGRRRMAGDAAVFRAGGEFNS